MNISTRLKAPWFATSLLLVLPAFAARAQAFCQPGEVQACIVNGQDGEKTCQDNGRYGPCIPIEAPAPPVPATPSVTDRTGNSLKVVWDDPGMWASASYELQYQVGWSWVRVGTISSSHAEITHTGLQPDTLYCYRVEVTANTGVRDSNSWCKYTTDGTGREINRVQIEFHTGTVDDSETDDDIRVELGELAAGGVARTWVDYGRNDFEGGDIFTYDLNQEPLTLFGDISKIKITKFGTDGWCLADFRLLVNGVSVYAEDFHALPGGCRWLDEDDGHQPSYEVSHAALHGHTYWRNYTNPNRVSIDQTSEAPLVKATLILPRFEVEQRMEGIIGDKLHGQELHWGDLRGRAWTEADQSTFDDSVAMHLDLEADTPYWFDPDVNFNFDLRFQTTCGDNNANPRVDLTMEHLDPDVDQSWFATLVTYLVVPPCYFGCVELFEMEVANRIKDKIDPITKRLTQSVPPGTTCLATETIVHPNADVELIFHLLPPH
jgi:fibronectin type III domain protein